MNLNLANNQYFAITLTLLVFLTSCGDEPSFNEQVSSADERNGLGGEADATANKTGSEQNESKTEINENETITDDSGGDKARIVSGNTTGNDVATLC